MGVCGDNGLAPLALEGGDELVEDADDPHDLGRGEGCGENQVLRVFSSG